MRCEAERIQGTHNLSSHLSLFKCEQVFMPQDVIVKKHHGHSTALKTLDCKHLFRSSEDALDGFKKVSCLFSFSISSCSCSPLFKCLIEHPHLPLRFARCFLIWNCYYHEFQFAALRGSKPPGRNGRKQAKTLLCGLAKVDTGRAAQRAIAYKLPLESLIIESEGQGTEQSKVAKNHSVVLVPDF